MAMAKEYTDKDFKEYLNMWIEQVKERMDEIVYADKKKSIKTDPQTLWDRAVRSVDSEWGPEMHQDIKNHLGADYEGTIKAFKNRMQYEKEMGGLKKLREIKDHYFDERKRRKRADPLFEKETRGLDMLRWIRDNVKLTRIGSPQGSIKININPEAIRRKLEQGLSRLKEEKDRRLESQQLDSSYSSRGPTTIRGRSIDHGKQIL